MLLRCHEVNFFFGICRNKELLRKKLVYRIIAEIESSFLVALKSRKFIFNSFGNWFSYRGRSVKKCVQFIPASVNVDTTKIYPECRKGFFFSGK